MQRSENLSTAAKTLLLAGVLIPLTGGISLATMSRGPTDLNFSQTYSFFLRILTKLGGKPLLNLLAIAHTAYTCYNSWTRILKVLSKLKNSMCLMLPQEEILDVHSNTKSQYEKGWSLCLKKGKDKKFQSRRRTSAKVQYINTRSGRGKKLGRGKGRNSKNIF